MPLEPNQLSLFSKLEINRTSVRKQNTLVMNSDTLSNWKSQIFTHQQRARQSKHTLQTTLFDITLTHADLDAEAINPFNLPLHSISFYRLPANTSGETCIYFVIDNAAQLLLYIGETCRSNMCRKGTRDCKRYIENYQSLHYHSPNSTQAVARTNTNPKVAIAFQQRKLDFWGASFI